MREASTSWNLEISSDHAAVLAQHPSTIRKLAPSLARTPFPASAQPSRSDRDRRMFSSSRTLSASHFDTHLFVKRLQENGLTRPQAEGLMSVLAEVIDESVRGMEGGLVSKADQEKVRLCLCTSLPGPLFLCYREAKWNAA